MAHALNSDHEVHYFSETGTAGAAKVLKQARKFIKESPTSVNTFQMQVEWDDETDDVKYVGYLVHGGW